MQRQNAFVIDYFALGLTHFLILVAAIRMIGNKQLDREGPDEPAREESGR